MKGSRQYQTRITTMAQLGQLSNLIQLSKLKKFAFTVGKKKDFCFEVKIWQQKKGVFCQNSLEILQQKLQHH